METQPGHSRGVPAPEIIGRALSEYGLSASLQQIEQVLSYLQLLKRWNERIDLTAIQNPLEILYRHFCESMYAAVAVPIEGGRLADVGSGGGFPGLPLKIIRPELDISLIESNIKRATFLTEVVRELRLSSVRVLVSRYEDLNEEVAPVDYVCVRALGGYGELLNWAASRGISARQVVLWVGGRDLEEVCTNEKWNWAEPILLPHSLRRFLLVGTSKR